MYFNVVSIIIEAIGTGRIYNVRFNLFLYEYYARGQVPVDSPRGNHPVAVRMTVGSAERQHELVLIVIQSIYALPGQKRRCTGSNMSIPNSPSVATDA